MLLGAVNQRLDNKGGMKNINLDNQIHELAGFIQPNTKVMQGNTKQWGVLPFESWA